MTPQPLTTRLATGKPELTRVVAAHVAAARESKAVAA